MLWGELSLDEKVEIFRRRERGESISSLAKSLGMNENSLRGRLSEFRKEVSDINSDDFDDMRVSGGGNHLQITMTIPEDRITTLDKLLEVCQVDTSVWDVERWIVNTWEGFRKNEQRDIRWDDGKANGRVLDDGDIRTKTLYQVKVWLIRKNPIALEPVVQPLEISIRFQERARPNDTNDGVKSALIIPDLQVGFSRDLKTGALLPFHDRGAMDIVLRIAKEKGFDKVVFLGDLLDLPDWSDNFIRSPEFYFTTQPAIVELAWWLGQLRLILPNAEMFAIEGNHEQRMEKAVMKNMAAAYHLSPAYDTNIQPVLSVPRLLGLDKLGIEWVSGYPDAEVWLADDLVCVHGERARAVSGATARVLGEDLGVSIVFGHIHRREMVIRSIVTRSGQKVLSSTCPGCLCKIDGTVPGNTKRQGWSQGFAIAYYGDGLGSVVEVVPIEEGGTLYHGKVYKANFDLQSLRKDTGWMF